MLTVNFINRDSFASWYKTPEFWMEVSEFNSLSDWCDDNFGVFDVAYLRFQSSRKWSFGNLRPSPQHQIRLYFKNEADYGFFLLKYNGTLINVF